VKVKSSVGLVIKFLDFCMIFISELSLCACYTLVKSTTDVVRTLKGRSHYPSLCGISGS